VHHNPPEATWARGTDLDIIECGGATGELHMSDDGIGTVVFSGLLVPANFLALGVLAMRAGIERQAGGLLYRNDLAAICCDPVSMTAAYPHLAPALRALPVAFVVNAGQAELYGHVVQRAAAAGLVRRAFFSEADARAWLQQVVRALASNRAWWALRQPQFLPAAPRHRRSVQPRTMP
jgi:hypothetical protein